MEDIVKALRGPGTKSKDAVITTFRVCLTPPCGLPEDSLDKTIAEYSEQLHIRHFVIIGNLTVVTTVLSKVST